MGNPSALSEVLGYVIVFGGLILGTLGWQSFVMYIRARNERIRREQIQSR